MSSPEVRYFRVGLFVLAGMALTAAAVVALGRGTLFEDQIILETYFDESVQGLDIGSPLKLRGVALGSVSTIGLAADFYDLDPQAQPLQSQKILVRMKVTADGADLARRTGNIQRLIDDGLRVRLSQSGLTGTAYIEAEIVDAERNPPMPISWQPEYTYVPSTPSRFRTLSSAAERILDRLEDAHFDEFLVNLDALVVTLQQRVAAIDVRRAQDEFSALMADLEQTNKTLRGAIARADLEGVSAGARDAIRRVDATAARVQGLVEGGSYDFGVTLENLRVASEDLRELMATAREYPSQLLLGTPPAKSPIPTQ